MSDDMIKQKYLSLVEAMKKDGHSLVDEPVLFRWSWPEAPDIEFQLLIRGVDENEESEQIAFVEQDEEDESYSIEINKPTIH